MPKVNLNGLPGPAYRTLTKTYTDPLAPGVELTLTLRALVDEQGHPDNFRVALALERAEAFEKKFAETGFPFPDGAVPVSEPLAQALAYLEVRQQGAPEECYTIEELVGLPRSMPSAWQEIGQDMLELDGRAETEEPDPNA